MMLTMTTLLDAFANIVCRLIWVGAWFAKPFRSAPEPLVENIARRDWDWSQHHRCASCKNKTLHRFIEWVEGPERPVTAECECGHVETIS
jgi:hypothetical protein